MSTTPGGSPPPLTDEERAAALERARLQKAAETALEERLRKDPESLGDILEEGQTNDEIGRMKVLYLLMCAPGVTRTHATEVMARLNIAPQRVSQLSAADRVALAREIYRPSPAPPPDPGDFGFSN